MFSPQIIRKTVFLIGQVGIKNMVGENFVFAFQHKEIDFL